MAGVVTWEMVRTQRLVLSRPSVSDVVAVHGVYADPRVWAHVPRARHASVQQTQAMLEVWEQEWVAAGLGQWVVRIDQAGPVLGNVGCAVRSGESWWSLSYRLHPDAQGHGYACEAASVALSAAREVALDRPVVASLVEHNDSSRRLAERLGLRLVFRGPDARNPDLGGVRLLYADRPVDPGLLDGIANR